MKQVLRLNIFLSSLNLIIYQMFGVITNSYILS